MVMSVYIDEDATRMTMVMIVDEIVTTKKETRKNGGGKARTKQVLSRLAKSSREKKDDG